MHNTPTVSPAQIFASGVVAAGYTPNPYTPQYPTVAELATMTAQDVFDRAAVHLLRQNRPSQAAGSCLYRGPDNTCCAVGVLIPQELYSEALNDKAAVVLATGETPNGIAMPVPAPLMEFAALHSGLLTELQGVHDLHDPEDWRGLLGDVAEMHSLSTAAMDAVVAA